MELKLSFGVCNIKDQLSEKIDDIEMEAAVVVSEVQSKIKTAANSNMRQQYSRDLQALIKDYSYKLKAAYITEHDFDLKGVELWEFLKNNCLKSDSNKINAVIESLGKLGEAENLRGDILRVNSASSVETQNSLTSSVGVNLTT